MDMNEYVLEVVTLSRLAELRADADRWHRAQSAMAGKKVVRPWRVALAHGLIRLGMRLHAGAVHAPHGRTRLGVAGAAPRGHGAVRG
ncbi:MAG TPA: hypothetical protein VGL09_04965 [Methylomirabilota bacterium]|jgi:hypothetical protein